MLISEIALVLLILVHILKLVLVKLLNHGQDHVQLILLNWDTESFLALNKN